MVSQLGHATIANQFATAKTAQAASSGLRRSQPITRMPHRLDRRAWSELLPQPAHADVDHVRARIEVVSPHLREQPLTAHDLAGVDEQVMEEPELPVREIDQPLADASLPPGDVQDDAPAAKDVLVAEGGGAAQPHANAREQLV